jgi:hypothetical protein
MTLNRQDGLETVHVGVANRGRDSALTFLRTDCSQSRTSRQEDLTLPTEWGQPAGYLLAGTAALAFCCGLLGLAVSSPFDVAVPRWLILAYGVGCALLAALAPLLSRPGQDSCDGKDVNVDRWTATWRDAGPPPGAPSGSISIL